MTADAFEQYVPGDSFLHRAAPVVKVCGAGAFILCVVLCPASSWPRSVACASIPLLAALAAGVPGRWMLARVAVVLPFVLLAGASLPFVAGRPGEALWQVPGTTWAVPLSAVELFASILLKSTLCVLAVALLLATTGFHRLLGALQLLRVPALFVSLLCFMYRYLFVLWDETVRMTRARNARAPRQRPLERLRTVGHMAGSLFLRSYERAERVAHAMVARGFDGTMRLTEQSAGSAAQWLAVGGFTAACAAMVVWR
ncbi:MAG: cobalt ECF transporter T component CbiQ [Armatimonadetes bacterium CG06_land_8_20_14_3_00_66_21]|nr:cobalt ECF transporter T component CbiQ [Armatimonadota bacterium]NCP30101.1 cobalt ECF transporter T component CbiQ [Armatimonadota bacterium]PIU90485.1 MAG: cobalt ECF transporter T component CbiQ [Armatimonadetes bacterium CG06_land_8_20_14_3_00_66_21]PIX42521.1 MAG: cobalt ECF transporter T component CbiQ [Armatimonadetes bacterium CG_4_8_14_3_um_filter_66_20]